MKWLSPLFGGLLGFLYLIAAGSGSFQGWYWSELSGPQSDTFSLSLLGVFVAWGVGGFVGGTIAGLIAEVASWLAILIIPLPLAVGLIRFVQLRVVPGGSFGLWAGIFAVLVVGVIAGGIFGRSVQRDYSRSRAPGGIWWPHWLYFIVVAYFLPIYLIQTATNIWIDFKLGFHFLTHPGTWFWWRSWTYWFFLSWFAGMPTYIILAGYSRLYDVMNIESEYGWQKKFNAFFMYFLTVPTIAWFLTFAWRWAVAKLFNT